MASTTEQAAKLKEDGNRLYGLKDYAAAHGKYSKAISLDASNAVLYANRAACLFAMKKYLDAAADCEKATKIDPLYTKAWARLGAAFKNVPGCKGQSIEAYRRALSTLPIENLSESERNIKVQCETELASVTKKTPTDGKYVVAPPEFAEKLPWQRALRMKAELQAEVARGILSSGWVLFLAYEEFTMGMNMIKQVRRIGPSGGIFGAKEGIQWLSNSLITDSRVFHLDDPDFLKKYRIQVEFEVVQNKAFVTGGAENLITEIPKMLEKSGWDVARPAFTTTVRCWMMSGFLTDSLGGDSPGAVQFYDEVIQALEWGRQAWRNVPKEQRGAVFEDTFLRGVKCLRFDCYMKASLADPSKFPLEMLHQDAQDMIREVNAAVIPSDPHLHPGYILASFVYPKGHALAMTGLYYRDLGKVTASRSDAKLGEAETCLREAVKAYQQAADVYPKDDENHVYYLCCSYDLLILCGSYSVREALTIGEKVRAALPGMKKIWEFSSMASERDKCITRVLAAEADLRKEVEAGRYTMSSYVSPIIVAQ